MLQIPEKHFFIGERLVELKLIDYATIQARFDETFVFKALLILLPLEVDEGGGRIVRLHPCSPS
jgi:hypothetical protein